MSEEYSIRVYDVAGRMRSEASISGQTIRYLRIADLSTRRGLKRGLYFLTLESRGAILQRTKVLILAED